MRIVFGGAFQGKLEYALGAYGVGAGDVQTFSGGTTVDASKKLYDGCHELVLALVKENMNPTEFFKENIHSFQGKILIFDETSGGVVPVDAVVRKAREENGRAMTYLCGQARQVTRVFCGIPTRIKG